MKSYVGSRIHEGERDKWKTFLTVVLSEPSPQTGRTATVAATSAISPSRSLAPTDGNEREVTVAPANC